MGKSNAIFDGGPLDGKENIVIHRNHLDELPDEIYCSHPSIAGKRIVYYMYELISDLGTVVKYEYRGQVDAPY